MASAGNTETAALKANMEAQLSRLLTQLQDLEDSRADLDDTEYQEMKSDTLQQLQEFRASLDKMAKGNMTLVDSFGAMQLAMQAAVSEAFSTPEVIALFARSEPDALRTRLVKQQQEFQLKKISRDVYLQRASEVLGALKRMGAALTVEEEALFEANKSAAMAAFVAAGTAGGLAGGSEKAILNQAGAAVKQAKK